MSIQNTLQLPDQASPTGTVSYIALGGDGFTAPRGVYSIKNFSSTGDGTGGIHLHEIIMDPDYCSMIQYVTYQHNPATATTFKLLVTGPGTPVYLLQGTTAPIVSALGSTNAVTWQTPAIIQPGGPDQVPTLSITVQNIDTIVLALNASIFTYDIRARESALYAHLVAARGGI